MTWDAPHVQMVKEDARKAEILRLLKDDLKFRDDVRKLLSSLEKSVEKQYYEVIKSRFDTPPEIAGTFEAKDDETAKIIFEERFKKDKSLSWDRLVLNRVDQYKKVTRLESRD